MGFRTDAVAGVYALLQSYRAAHPERIAAVSPSRPNSFPNLPAAYVGSRDETIKLDAGTRVRSLTGLEVVVVDGILDNLQTMARRDQVVDDLVDLLSDNPHAAGANTVIGPTAVGDLEFQLAGAEAGPIYHASVITLGDTDIQEGRS